MPDFNVGGEKPKRPHDHLGIDVELDRKVIAQDEWAKDMLKQIGGTLTRAASQAHSGQQMKYLGSIALHICRTEGDSITGTYHLANVNQIEVDGVNQGVVMAALSNLTIEIGRRYGKKHTTTDSKDRRGQGDT